MLGLQTIILQNWAETFGLGKPDWYTPGEVVYREKALLLRRFTYGRSGAPVLVMPPQAGHHSSIADFGPDKSIVDLFIRSTTRPVYGIEWQSATIDRKDENIDDLVLQTDRCVDAIGGEVIPVGLCQAGWLAAIYAALFPEKVRALYIGGAPLDFQAGDGYIKRWVNILPRSFFENLVAMGGGILWGGSMLMAFKNMHPVEHYFNFPAGLTIDMLTGNDRSLERTRNFRRWYEYPHNIAGGWYLAAVDRLFRNNRLLTGFPVLGREASLAGIRCPIGLLGGGDDDITPPEQVMNAVGRLGASRDDIFQTVIPGCGHIGLFIARRALWQYWTKAIRFIEKRI